MVSLDLPVSTGVGDAQRWGKFGDWVQKGTLAEKGDVCRGPSALRRLSFQEAVLSYFNTQHPLETVAQDAS